MRRCMDDLLPLGRIGIVGAGRVGRAMALGLGPHSAAAPLIWSRSAGRAQAAVAEIGNCLAVDRLSELLEACDVIAIAVADDAIPDVVAAMAANPMVAGRFIFHVSGGSGTTILDPLENAGARTAAVHPAMTFTGNPRREVERMMSARFAVTGSSPDAAAQARTIVAALGGTAVEIAEAQRALYHAALCHAANHLVTLIAGASEALASAGVAEPGSLLAPLARAALENSLVSGHAALSGPILRDDAGTVARHLQAISDGSPELLDAYRAMAQATLDAQQRRSGLAQSELRAVLSRDSVLPTSPVRA